MKKVSLLALTALFIASCSDETTVFRDASDDLSLEGNVSVLKQSVVFDDAGVLDIADEDRLTGKTAKGSNDEQAGDYPLTLVARVDAPSYSGGENLGASHMHLDGDFAYISYNTVEDGYAGAIDIIDVSDPNDPTVTSRLYYTNVDVNAIQYSDGYVYAVGGVDSEQSTLATANSILAKIPASGGRLDISAGIEYAFQEGFNATDVKVNGNSVLVGSGKDGYLVAYNKSDLSIQKEAAFADLRSIAIDNNNEVAILDGSIGVSFLDADFNSTRDIAIDSDFGDFSKRTIAISDSEVIVSEGSKGAGIYSKASGNFIKHLPILINPEDTEPTDIVTNAVAVNENVVLMANGGAGLCLSEDQGDNTELVGVIDLNGSINYVASKGDYILAASGKAGLQIVKLNRPDATLVDRCSDLPAYSGSSTVTIAQGETQSYSDSKRFRSINVDGSLLLCGVWAVTNEVNINENALLEMNGNFFVGRNNQQRNITVAENGTLRVEGNLVIYGDLVLEDGATLEFLGDNSVAYIFGQVIRNGESTIKGNFNDVYNRF